MNTNTCRVCKLEFLPTRRWDQECSDCAARCVVACIECGGSDPAGYVPETRERMLARSLCFTCLFWLDRIEAQADPKACVVNGNSYHDAGKRTGTPDHCLGFGGRQFRIVFTDGRVIETNNLFGQGPVPERFRDRLPDTARFET